MILYHLKIIFVTEAFAYFKSRVFLFFSKRLFHFFMFIWVLYYGERSGIKLHVSLTTQTAMPLEVVETTGHKHDGPMGVQCKGSISFFLVLHKYIKER